MRRTTEARQTRCKDPTKEVVCFRFSKCKEPSSPTRLQTAAFWRSVFGANLRLEITIGAFAMPNIKSVAISFLVLGVGGLVGCAVDDSVAPEGKGGAAGTLAAGTAGRTSSGGPTTSAGGKAGSFGVAGSGGATGGGAGSIRGNSGEGGSAGAG